MSEQVALTVEKAAARPEISRPYFRAIDGLRAVCVVLVIAEHQENGFASVYRLPTWLGVDLFFLISGFIITNLLFREEDQTASIDLFAFYVRRFFRIVPVYGAVFALYLALALRNAHRWHLMMHYRWYYVTMSAEFIKFLPYDPANQAPFGSTWTLGVEEKFYLVFPLVFFVLVPKRGRKFAVPVLLLLLSPLLTSFTAAYWLFRSYYGLLLGCTLAMLLHAVPRGAWARTWSRTPAIVPVLLLTLSFWLVKLDWRFTFIFDVAGAALLASLLLHDSWLTRLLSSRYLVWLGRRSYSMYLVHTFALDLVARAMRGRSILLSILEVLIAAHLAALIAGLLYITIEEPARIYGKRVLSRHRRVASSISPDTAYTRQSTFAGRKS